MTLDDINPDMTIKMTDKMKRLFQHAGCEPAFHCCHKTIRVGLKFKLATRKHGTDGAEWYEDVMLCNRCTIGGLKKEELRQAAEHEAYRRTHGYSRPHKT